MSDTDFSVPEGWGQVKPRQVLDLPSGSKVLIKELDLPDLLNLGILDIVDQFSQEALPAASIKGSSAEKKFLKDLAENKGQFDKMLDVMNKVTAAAVVKPPVIYLPPAPEGEPEKEPEEGKVYAHLVPIEDRLAIFEKGVAGMEDLFRSREGQAQDVAAVADVQDVQQDPVGTSGDIAPHPSLLPE
ncbi:tail assembly chaperone [Gordonia phage LittleFella]|nr:tail assembly chaperone [Gordonia phage LittleFella]